MTEQPRSPGPGFRWCPACNGDGVVWEMDTSPEQNETERPCEYPGCAEGQGIVARGPA